MDLATGAMGSLLPKLVELLRDEYKLQTGVRKDVEFLEREMRSMDAALREVGRVPRDQLDEQVKIWADEVRELSFQMEDAVDRFMVRVEGSEPAVDPDSFKGLMKKMTKFFNKGKTRHQIANTIEELKEKVKEVADRRGRYIIKDAAVNPTATTTVDPRMLALFKDQKELVGIKEPRDQLIKRLTDEDDGVSNSNKQQKLKILSIFGSGGLGKTTLAKAVYDNLQVGFVRRAFVSVGQNPNTRKVFMDILFQLNQESCSTAALLDEGQLIGKLRGLLDSKRYLIVVDDIWDERSWEIIKCVLIDSKCGSRVIITTRILRVAELADYVYNQEPLSLDRSKELLYARLFIGKRENSHDQSVEIADKILHKCGGVPLAIITIASLLVGKPREYWPEVYNSVGFGLHEDNMHVDNTRKILLYSYYDLPFYIRTCLLYLSIYPEDREIEKDTLIWKWIAEGFIHEKSGMRLFELGEGYFNELINRSMIQPVASTDGIVYACRVHDLVLDMIYSLSKDENFVVLLGSNKENTCSQSNAHRLAMQSRVIDEHHPVASMPQVRSFNAIMCRFDVIPQLSNFEGLRVLDFEECAFKEGHPYHIEHLGKLLQLRYLRLANTPITELPEEIARLKFLQALYLEFTGIEELPRSVGLLKQLRCLHLTYKRISGWIGDLTSLEELWLFVCPLDFVKELGKLTELRDLTIDLDTSDATLVEDLTESLGNLQKLQAIRITLNLDSYAQWDNCQGYSPSPHLHYLDLTGFFFESLPPWINSSCLPYLTHLSLVVYVEARDVEILGRLPNLVSLSLRSNRVAFPDMAGGDAFPKLRNFFTSALPRFFEGAMPRLEDLEYFVKPGACNGNLAALERDFASLWELPCLQKLRVYISSTSETGLEEAKAALRHAVNLHPNKPALAVKADLLG